MRFDPEIARNILLAVEETEANQRPKDINLPEVPQDTLVEHIELLNEAGLLEATLVPSGMGGQRYIYARVKRLTYAGHQFLADARNDSVWQKTVATVKEKGGSISVSVLTQLLAKMAAAHFGLPG